MQARTRQHRTQQELNVRLTAMLKAAQLLPVVTVSSVEQALELSGELLRQGLTAVEITLRSAAALPALTAVKQAYPELLVAAGTVNTPTQMQAVAEAGVDFAVSPGTTPALIAASQTLALPYLPGVATPSEMLAAGERGLEYLKLYPAVAVGGVALLKSIASPLAQFKFCPTGGLNESNYEEFLVLPNVVCVGGSWMVPG